MAINLNYKNLFSYLKETAIFTQEELAYMKVDVKYSKNSYWLIEVAENNYKLVIKQTPNYHSHDRDERIDKEREIYKFLQVETNLYFISSLTPEIIYFDEMNSILIYKYLDRYINLESYYMNNNNFPHTIAELIGNTLAKLHKESISSEKFYKFLTKYSAEKIPYQLSYPDYISEHLFQRLKPENLKKTPTYVWRFIGNFQKADALIEVIKDLLFQHRRCCLTHNNIQFKNLLISKNWHTLSSDLNHNEENLIKLIDWETCSWGDPACDLGKAIAGYFLFWLNSMIMHPTIEIKKSIQLAAIPLEVVRPSIVATIKAYINAHTKVLEGYPEFLRRVIQFAGLAVIYQLLTEFQFQPEIALCHQEVYFYIAAQLLCKPEKFMAI
ncbi:aminoglycoside phosphotransferase family protein [Calothrix sp. NIES-2098]|uniref:aminoglycoside phosphotransferase family protein n=1 Tax=Calothrix sp. NIES-2098 TaxID=1954171 RepID=UPI000B60B00C|nr:aminoglycoside phosphotransferase [Calothrix sp. NIES-2098]